jgi:Kef-type K+ transport system membrane component KefB/CBS domain-containing protein
MALTRGLGEAARPGKKHGEYPLSITERRGQRAVPMPPIPVEEIWLIVRIGLMLFVGFLAGTLTARLRIPRVTGYLFAGLLIGPSVIGVIDSDALPAFDIVSQLALGLIMFNIGGRFKARDARRFAGKHLTVTAFEMGLTWVLVGGAIWALSRDGTLALLVGFIAMATAPATTLVVVKEYESEGSLTSNLIALVGINNFFCLVLFPVLMMALVGQEAGEGFTLISVGKSLLLGVVLGLILSILEERANAPSQQVVLGFCFIALVIGLSYAFGGSGPLSALVMGATKINSSPRGPALFERLDSGAYPFYVLFFVIAGANLHVETLIHAGLFGFAYIIVRSFAKIAGAALGAHIAGLSRELKHYLGPAMISHAGVAIGLAMAVGRMDSPSGKVAQAIVLGSIVVYEVIGPLCVRFALVRCGEVKMVSLLPHLPGQSSIDNLERIISQVKRSLGLPVKGLGQTGEPPVARHVMRSSVETVPYNTRFDELLKVVSHARYDLLPVVDRDGNYMGNISFLGIRDIIFDQALADLVIAGDLLDYESAYVVPDEPLGAVLQKFHDVKDEIGCLPVVAKGEKPRVIGMVRQRDVVDMFRRIRTQG